MDSWGSSFRPVPVICCTRGGRTYEWPNWNGLEKLFLEDKKHLKHKLNVSFFKHLEFYHLNPLIWSRTCGKNCNIIFFCSLRLKRHRWTSSLCVCVRVCVWPGCRQYRMEGGTRMWVGREEEIKTRECQLIQLAEKGFAVTFVLIGFVDYLSWSDYSFSLLPYCYLQSDAQESPSGPGIKKYNSVDVLILWKVGV